MTVTQTNPAPLGIVYTSGRMRQSPEEVKARLQGLTSAGFQIRSFEPETPSADGSSAGSDMDRAMQLAQALTLRRLPVLWAARGGYGSSAMIEWLDSLLPPVIPDKTLIGYSDVSLIGNLLAMRYPNLRYVMGANALETDLSAYLTHSADCPQQLKADYDLTLAIARGEDLPDQKLSGFAVATKHIQGRIVPLNLSLAEYMACLKRVRWAAGSVLFVEDINEDFHRVLRKFDSLKAARLLESCEAIVLGDLGTCRDADDQQVDLQTVARIVSARTGKPVCVLPVFGHGQRRFPLVAGASVELKASASGEAEVNIGFGRDAAASTVPQKSSRCWFLQGEATTLLAQRDPVQTRLHFLGIGGTGMAAVAGMAKDAGYAVSGSDGPIYPPMSETLEAIGLKPFVGYRAENLRQAQPVVVVLANAVSRLDGSLGRNAEFEELLNMHVPVFSFPGFLHHAFLERSLNIVVSGTHGKTTTTSCISHALREIGFDPSFLIGGAPKNFQHGFHLGQSPIFVLEGDEYDTALFDKGPKFLHYNPKIALINNIEFDHADIYPHLEAICEEFHRLVSLTAAQGGLVVANLGDKRVKEILEGTPCPTIGYIATSEPSNTAPPAATDSEIPTWTLLQYQTLDSGTRITAEAPDGSQHSFDTKLFGGHNALNAVAAVATLHAHHLLQASGQSPQQKSLLSQARQLPENVLTRWFAGIGSFAGVRRRFELISRNNDIAVFDDFAHHPTAIAETIKAFRSYHNATVRQGLLRICFDPRNATMRRNILQRELTDSLKFGDSIYIGKVMRDLRIPESERMCGKTIAKGLLESGRSAQSFDDPDALLQSLLHDARPGDTVVFMSSGSFDNLPRRFSELLNEQQSGRGA